MRFPRQHLLFGLDNRAGLSALLSGRGGHDAVQRIPGLVHLSVLPAGVVPPNALELLARPAFAALLRELSRDFDVILFDTPAAAASADAQTVARHAAAAMIVARRNTARLRSVRLVSDAMTNAGATVVGSVLNEF
jgi:Mrp family chromosome partitioning ATPase